MSKTKDPRSENIPVDLDDDDDIIELTEEVIVKPKKDDSVKTLHTSDADAPESAAEKPPKTDETEPEPDDNEDDTIDLSEATESETEGTVLDLDEAFADDGTDMDEDDIIASAIEESLGADDDEPESAEDRIKLTDDVEVDMVPDDDIINFREDDDESVEASDSSEADTDEGIFQDEEEIPLEHESSEDEYDFFALDDNKPLEELETIPMTGEEQVSVRDDDATADPLAKLEIGTDEDDDIIAMDAEAQDAPELMAFDDDETLEFESGGDLPDLTDEIEFDFDDDIDDNDLAEADDDAVGDSDDIIARAVEKSLAPDAATTRVDSAAEPEFEIIEDTDAGAEEDQEATDEVLSAKTAEELRKLAEADDWDDIDDDMDLEFDGDEERAEIVDISGTEPEIEAMALEDLEDTAAEDEDDIIEITEFDEHFPEEDERKLAHAGVLDGPNGDEDDFLELIEVEEDDTTEDEEVIEFSKSEALADEDELDSFFSKALAEEPAFEDGEMEPVAETTAMSTDMAMATAPPADEDEEFDFGIDSSEISQQVDRLDTFLADDPATEPEVASLPAEPPAEAERPDEAVSVTPDQIDAIVERVIEEKFGGNIETIIYEVIEKAVSKEIDRLKGALLDGDSEES